jgi:type IV secretory pathway VirB4 component
MPFKDPEKLKQYKKEWYEKNKEKLLQQYKEYRENNKEKVKEYRQTDNRKKSNRINTWKHKGVKSEDFDKLYEKYINTKNCEKCNVELVEGNYGYNKRCLDHCHETGEFRFVLCNTCNVKYR